MKIFVVSSGEYSDYRIYAVYTDEAMAQRQAQVAKGDVEEWESDQPISEHEQPGMLCFQGDIEVESGTMYVHQCWPGQAMQVINKAYSFGTHGRPEVLFVRCWARDAEHAGKIMVERRQELLRERGIIGDAP